MLIGSYRSFPCVAPRCRFACVLLRCLHLDSDAVERLSRGVEEPVRLVAALRRHVHDQTSLTIPGLDRLYDIPVWRQLRPSGPIQRSRHR